MSNVVRLVSGGTIQVRTGVVQGIGAQGPRGVAGPQGPQGEQGPLGNTGPMGQIIQLQGRTTMAASNSLTANTDATLAFGAVSYDDLSCFTSTTNITLTNGGDYLLSCWVRYDAGAAGHRELWFTADSVLVARTSLSAVASAVTYQLLSFPFRAVGGEVVNALARSAATLAIGVGVCTVTRIGSGPIGPQGDVGPTGPVGPEGPQGEKGDDGDASGGFAHYSDLL